MSLPVLMSYLSAARLPLRSARLYHLYYGFRCKILAPSFIKVNCDNDKECSNVVTNSLNAVLSSAVLIMRCSKQLIM